MQKVHPKSNALRQTKICMAAATVVAAAALPGYAVAEESAAPAWQTTKEGRQKALNGKISASENAPAKWKDADEALRHQKSFGRFASTVREALGKPASKEKLQALGEVKRAVEAEITVIASKNPTEGEAPAHDKEHATALGALKEALAKIDAEAKLAASNDDRKALDALVAEAKVNGAITAAQTALDGAKKNLDDFNLLKHKQSVWEAVDSDEMVARLDKTFVLDANAPNAEKNGTKSAWSDMNLQTFKSDDAVGTTANAHTKLAQGATLELGSFSGSDSDAIYGLAENNGQKTRAIDTLRILADADHRVHVADGVLSMKNGIEGSGKIAIDVGPKGELNFLADGVGVDAGAQQVTLTATGPASGSAEAAGKIAFGKGTSAGKARIEVVNGAALGFSEGANAGASTINIGGTITQDEVEAAKALDENSTLAEATAASATFDGASAADATIRNSGNLTFTGADLGNAKITNEVKGIVKIEGKPFKLEDSERPETRASVAGNAELTNRGTLTVTDAKLGNMHLTNEGQASIIDPAPVNLYQAA